MTGLHRFECVDCGLEWTALAAPQAACHRCGSLYCRWLTAPDRPAYDGVKPPGLFREIPAP